MSSNTFGELVRKTRTARGISLRTLAEELGYSASYLSDIENGKRAPFSEGTVLAHLSTLLGLNPEDVKRAAEVSRGSFVLPQASVKHNEVAATLMHKWAKLNDAQLDEILRVIS